ncbi:hypothetical protein [Metaclostridioides mangenotii]|uniref:hypothetical protein n=1 Tax=Metaclostridioides mangenotii TaxID=1540 RepID=UPI000A5125E7|nr:hypothetical protein [Clostridioides mangenotii]
MVICFDLFILKRDNLYLKLDLNCKEIKQTTDELYSMPEDLVGTTSEADAELKDFLDQLKVGS